MRGSSGIVLLSLALVASCKAPRAWVGPSTPTVLSSPWDGNVQRLSGAAPFDGMPVSLEMIDLQASPLTLVVDNYTFLCPLDSAVSVTDPTRPDALETSVRKNQILYCPPGSHLTITPVRPGQLLLLALKSLTKAQAQ
jgi:hypothetical protein